MNGSFRTEGASDSAASTPGLSEEMQESCGARWEVGRSYPCALPKGHDGPHEHPMDPVPPDHMLAVSA